MGVRGRGSGWRYTVRGRSGGGRRVIARPDPPGRSESSAIARPGVVAARQDEFGRARRGISRFFPPVRRDPIDPRPRKSKKTRFHSEFSVGVPWP